MKVKFCRIFGDRLSEKLADFVEIFGTNFTKKQISWEFFRQISLEMDRFCTDLISMFKCFLTEIIICYFNDKAL